MPFESVFSVPEKDDLGYVLGWFCGGFVIFGFFVAIFYNKSGRPRIAFQAVAQGLGYIVYVGLLVFLMLVAGKLTQLWEVGNTGAEVIFDIFIVGVLAGPILTLRLLRALTWPPSRER